MKRHPSLFLRLVIGISRLLRRKPGLTSRMVEEASLFSSFFPLADSGSDLWFFILAVLICSCTSSSGLRVSFCGDSFPAECPPSGSAHVLHMAPSAHFTLYLCQPTLSSLEYSGTRKSPFPNLPESAGDYYICFNSTTYISTRAIVSPHYSQNLRIV